MRVGLLALSLLSACALSEPADVEYQYVTDRIVVPTTTVEAREQGFDIDGDSVGRPDNQIGSIVALLDLDLDVSEFSGERRNVGGQELRDRRRVRVHADATFRPGRIVAQRHVRLVRKV